MYGSARCRVYGEGKKGEKMLVLLLFLTATATSSMTMAMPIASSSSSITLRFHYPDDSLQGKGNSLTIRGDSCGLNWESGTTLSHSSADLWEIGLSCDKTVDKLQVKALVDDQTWQIGSNIVIDLSIKKSGQVDIFPYFFSGSGTTEIIQNVESKNLNNTRDVIVYLPPSYYENPLKPVSNVLLMHDGQNLFDPSTSFMGSCWKIQDTLNPLIYEGKMEEVMIIGVYNTPQRMDELTYSYDPSEKFGGKGDVYLDFLEQVVLPTVAQRYRTSSLPIGIGGSSLGGLISCYAAWTRGNVYNKGICMSSSFWWNSQDFNSTVMPSHKAPSPSQSEIYLDSGDSGDGKDDEQETLTVRGDMEKLGFSLGRNLFYYLDKGGEHNEHYWGQRFHEPMTALYSPKSITAQ